MSDDIPHNPKECRTCGGVGRPTKGLKTSRSHTPLKLLKPPTAPNPSIPRDARDVAFGRNMPTCNVCRIPCRPDDRVLPVGRYWAHEYCAAMGT
jgi:hypothetical protein